VRKAVNVSYGHGSSAGRVRGRNEDYHRVRLFPAPKDNLYLFAIADGMGGTAAGDLASKIAVEVLTHALSHYAVLLNGGHKVVPLEQAMERAFQAANREILREALLNPSRDGMGTTLTALVIQGWRAVLAHAGDSRAYMARQGTLKQLTRDHSWVALQVERGFLTPAQAREHDQRNVLVKALGPSKRVEPDVHSFPLEPGDAFVLSSDGLHGLVSDEELRAELSRGASLQSAAEYWISLAERRGGPDNITVVVARVTE